MYRIPQLRNIDLLPLFYRKLNTDGKIIQRYVCRLCACVFKDAYADLSKLEFLSLHTCTFIYVHDLMDEMYVQCTPSSISSLDKVKILKDGKLD